MKKSAFMMKTAVLLVAAVCAFGARAQTDAGAAPGAAQSGNGTTTARAQNHKLAKDVRHALTHAKGLDASHINVLAKGGAVSLAGSVPEAGQIDLAGAAAEAVPGVASINNQLHVHEPGN
ncbi:BON domain-containing protein [Paraburkholderia unamae]|uniref:BON domain-containing protein n=1 Tax=Paraburkholderia unamae TaxID=219649 RepID=UPI000DC37C52|nr:BON domain-containing protein [Paraburkholderia unamae]RAR57965.1 BON domain-containing protein [Paraburkholderia unamae]